MPDEAGWLAAWEAQGWPQEMWLGRREKELMGVMADWLEEQGRERAAWWCRRAVLADTRPRHKMVQWYDIEPADSHTDPASDVGKALFGHMAGGELVVCNTEGRRTYSRRADAWQDFIRAVLKLEG